MSPVTVHDLPPPPKPPRPVPVSVQIIVGLISLLIVVLGLRALPSAFVATPVTSEQPTAPSLAPAGEALASRTAESTAEPLAKLAALISPPAAEPPDGCPDAIELPEGARAVWRGRAAGCPDVLYASVNGVNQWVLRPANFPEALFEQLIELPAR